MDCLDRTNVVQSVVARKVLHKILHSAGLTDKPAVRSGKEGEKGTSHDVSELNDWLIWYLSVYCLREASGEAWGYFQSKLDSQCWCDQHALHWNRRSQDRLHEVNTRESWRQNNNQSTCLLLRTGKRTKQGAVNDGVNSIKRYIYGNFFDAHK